VSERARLGILALLLSAAGAVASAQDSYPADITPPPGTRYPCALIALPPGLPGVPPADRAVVNRTYSRVLRATQAKLVLLKALEEGQGMSAALARYLEETEALAGRQKADTLCRKAWAPSSRTCSPPSSCSRASSAKRCRYARRAAAWTWRSSSPRAGRPLGG